MQNPAYLTAYLRFKQDLEAENRRRGTRSRFSGSVKIPLQDLSRGKLNDIYVDPIEVFLPFAGLMGQDVTDPQGQMTGVQQVYTMAERLGLRPSPAIDIPLRASGALQADNSPEQAAQWGKGSIGAFTPQGGLIQGVTSALGIGGPGGVNIEEPIRNAIGLPDTGAYDPYRYGRSVSDISASLNAMQGPGMDPRPFLAAQEWIGKHKDSDLAKQLRQATPAEVAAELNIDPKLAALALEAARAGAKQASQQRAVAQIGSSMLGLRLQELPQGEQIRTGMADAERGAACSRDGLGERCCARASSPGQRDCPPGSSEEVVNKPRRLAANVLAARPWAQATGWSGCCYRLAHRTTNHAGDGRRIPASGGDSVTANARVPTGPCRSRARRRRGDPDAPAGGHAGDRPHPAQGRGVHWPRWADRLHLLQLGP
jgi:hypothetical protein